MGEGNRNKVFFLSFLDQIFLQFLDSFHEMLVKSPLTPLFQRGGVGGIFISKVFDSPSLFCYHTN